MPQVFKERPATSQETVFGLKPLHQPIHPLLYCCHLECRQVTSGDWPQNLYSRSIKGCYPAPTAFHFYYLCQGCVDYRRWSGIFCAIGPLRGANPPLQCQTITHGLFSTMVKGSGKVAQPRDGSHVGGERTVNGKVVVLGLHRRRRLAASLVPARPVYRDAIPRHQSECGCYGRYMLRHLRISGLECTSRLGLKSPSKPNPKIQFPRT